MYLMTDNTRGSGRWESASERSIRVAGNGAGVTWHYCRPPIGELEYEMDVRGIAVERLLRGERLSFSLPDYPSQR
jgi:hypothetical protein